MVSIIILKVECIQPFFDTTHLSEFLKFLLSTTCRISLYIQEIVLCEGGRVCSESCQITNKKRLRHIVM